MSLARNPYLYVAVSAAGLVIAASFGGLQGAEGMALGLFATTFSVVVLWMMVRLLGASSAAGQASPKASLVIILAFFIKLPLFVMLGTAAHWIGGAANPCFLAGLGLVYLCLVGWALAQR